VPILIVNTSRLQSAASEALGTPVACAAIPTFCGRSIGDAILRGTLQLQPASLRGPEPYQGYSD